jgi:hypothetical protein
MSAPCDQDSPEADFKFYLGNLRLITQARARQEINRDTRVWCQPEPGSHRLSQDISSVLGGRLLENILQPRPQTARPGVARQVESGRPIQQPRQLSVESRATMEDPKDKSPQVAVSSVDLRLHD